MKICNVTQKNFDKWISMMLILWPDHKKIELEKEFQTELKSKKYKSFLVQSDNGKYVGFINLSLRIDYVQGSKSSPVVYIEGIFVKPKYRKLGIAKMLIKEAEKWAKQKGCKELGSDAELKNKSSQKFHISLGFKEAGTNVHFIKKISVN